jgi:hypothetical protein
MKADDFAIEQLYGIERRRIINRSVIGMGVVNGFKMAKGRSDVGSGLALDEHGREIVLAAKATLGPSNLFLVAPEHGNCRPLPIEKAEPGRHYLLSIHYAERRFGDADLPGGCGCEKPEKNYICETAVFSLTELRERCCCGEPSCDWKCSCRTTDSCGEREPFEPREPVRPIEKPSEAEERPNRELIAEEPNRELIEVQPGAIDDVIGRLHETGELPGPGVQERQPPDVTHAPSHHRNRGPHACVCHRLMREDVDCAPPALCEWNGYWIDPCDGVPLACLTIGRGDDPCRPIDIDVLDPCGPRRFVKSNDLLYDFIRGCDLTQISWVSWAAWHRRRELMPWRLFASLFHLNEHNPHDPKNGWTAFAVRFSAPVIIDTIRYDSIAMRAITIEQATDWRLIRRIPITHFDFAQHGDAELPPGTTNQVRVHVSTDWIADEILGRSTWLTWDGFEIEFELDGFGILDCHRQPIDAEAIGLEAAPTGNGSPGGFYRSAFRVHAKPHKSDNAA